jgi:hypothetical protein
LRSLAAQALGLGAPVKSATRLPFAAVPAISEHSTIGAEAIAPSASARVPSMAMSMDAADQHGRTETGMPHAESYAPHSRRDYSTAPTISDHPTGYESAPRRAAPRTSSVARSLDAADETARPSHPLREPAEQNPAAPLSVTQPSGFDRAEFVEPARVPTLPPLIQPATRFVQPPAFAPPAGSARPANSRRHSTGSDATEVHVSIGRIEVTAVHEASPPPRRAAPARKSIPLNEYLAQRQRGRS